MDLFNYTNWLICSKYFSSNLMHVYSFTSSEVITKN